MIFESLTESNRKNKRFKIVFSNPRRVIHFGDKYGDTYIDHFNKLKRDNYIKRHSKLPLENWNEINPGSLSRYLLWGDDTDILINLENYLNKFNIGL